MVVAIRLAKTNEDKKRVYRFRYYVCNPETLHDHCIIDHENGWIYDGLDQFGHILYAEKDNKVVGTIRIIDNQNVPLPDHLTKHHQITKLEGQLGPGKISISDMFVLDPKMRGQTMASLLLSSCHQLNLQNNIAANCILSDPSMLKHFQRLGYRQHKPTNNIKDKRKDIPLILCIRDYKHLLQVMSPFALSLSYELDDLGSTKSIISEIYKDFETECNVMPYDVGTFWAIFSDTYTRLSNSQPGLFDGRSDHEIKTILGHSKKVTISAGQKISLPKNSNNTFGVIVYGVLGEGIDSNFGHHWFDIFKEGDTFVELKNVESKNIDLFALEETQIAVLPSDLLNILKNEDPILATRLSMNMISIIQQKLAEVEENTKTHIEEESVYLFL